MGWTSVIDLSNGNDRVLVWRERFFAHVTVRGIVKFFSWNLPWVR